MTYILTEEGKKNIKYIVSMMANTTSIPNQLASWIEVIGCEFAPDTRVHKYAIENDLMKYFKLCQP